MGDWSTEFFPSEFLIDLIEVLSDVSFFFKLY